MKLLGIIFLTALAFGSQQEADEPINGWVYRDDKAYWYEEGILQGYDENNPDYRGKEIYDSQSDAWYWLDNNQCGARAVDKDVYQESGAGLWAQNFVADKNGNPDPEHSTGKWVRYDSDGHMVKGWDYTEEGTYYFDIIYGTMAKGYAAIDGIEYYFNEQTGILERTLGDIPQDGWKTYDGASFWYEGGVRQGNSIDVSYRGKEIYDPDTDAWYWLDNVDNGKKAVDKDVYQESDAGLWADNEDGTGKWVRYDSDGHMVKGWDTNESGTYYFDTTYGTMAKGTVEIEGKTYFFNETTGILEQKVSPYKWLLTSNTCYNQTGGVIYRYNYEYNDDGRQTLISKYDAVYDRVIYEETWDYYESGEPKKQVVRNYTGGNAENPGKCYLNSEIISEYRDNVVVRITDNTYNEEGKLIVSKVTDYDGSNISGVNFYNISGELLQENIYKYDKNNYLIEIKYEFVAEPEYNMVLCYQNDADGNVLRMEQYDYMGRLVTSTVYSYCINNESQKSLLASYETRDEVEDILTEKREYDYDEKGNCVENRYYYRMNMGYDSVTNAYKYEMKLGNRQTFSYDEDGKQIGKDSYIYDRDGKERHDSGVVTVYGNYGSESLVQSYESYYAHSVMDESGHYIYDEDGKVRYELGFNYGYDNERHENGALVKQTFYEGNWSNRYTKKLNYWVEYMGEELPYAESAGRTYTQNPYCIAYNADGSVRYYNVYEYAAIKKFD